jgi:O-methyltransferase
MIKRAVARLLWRYAPRMIFWLRDLRGTAVTTDERFLTLYRELYNEGRLRMSIREAYNLFDLGKRAARLEAGAFAEFGVYRGGSAKILCEVKGDRPLWLFDTFEGMPESDRSIDEFGPGDFSDTSLPEVRRYLERYSQVCYVQGLFPTSVKGTDAETARFALVNLDVDLRRSTTEGLAFFYPRMVSGGILMSHDYSRLTAVKLAFDEFFADKPETVIQLFDTQALVVKA